MRHGHRGTWRFCVHIFVIGEQNAICGNSR